MNLRADLKPGRDIDALVAEKVMGWTNVQRNAYTPYGRDHCGNHPDGQGGWDGHGRMTIPRYSTDIKAVWEVAEHIKNLNFQLLIDVWNITVSIKNPDGKLSLPIYQAHADSISMAICLAALKVVGVIERRK